MPPGGGPPPHIHSREQECFYILDGELVLYVGEERIVARAGEFANVPIGHLHRFANESGRTARMLIQVVPAGLEEMFFEVGQALAEGATTAPPPAPEEIERLIAAAPRYGVELRLPH